VIGPEDLHDLFHAHAAAVEPIPHLAELGAGLTGVERHRRARVVVGTTIAAVAVAAGVTAVRTIETRSTRFDTAPATQRVVIAPDPQVTTSSPAPTVVADSTPTTAAAAPPSTAAVAAPPTSPPATSAPSHPAGNRVLTFRAASISDLSSADPPAVDYFGVAPPGSAVTASSPYGTASTHAGPDGKWSLHLVLADAPLGQRIRVVLSAPPLPELTFNFTHIAG
jgi:hypothetical protein